VDNVALHLEYSYRKLADATPTDDATESFVTGRVDFAF